MKVNFEVKFKAELRFKIVGSAKVHLKFEILDNVDNWYLCKRGPAGPYGLWQQQAEAPEAAGA